MTTSTPVEGRSRWVAPAPYAAPNTLDVTILATCTSSTGLDMTKPMSDDIWIAQSNANDRGSISIITIAVEGGHITVTSYGTTLANGTDEDAGHNKNPAGEVSNGDYYKKAQAAVASYQEHSDNLTKVGDPAKVDVVIDATVAHQQFM